MRGACQIIQIAVGGDRRGSDFAACECAVGFGTGRELYCNHSGERRRRTETDLGFQVSWKRGGTLATDRHDISLDLTSNRISPVWRVEAAGDFVAILMNGQNELIDTVDVPVVVEVGWGRMSSSGE